VLSPRIRGRIHLILVNAPPLPAAYAGFNYFTRPEPAGSQDRPKGPLIV
jgi:hypothetical protein